MKRDPKPPRQPLFWGSAAFALGLWIGVRAWRPPTLWISAVLLLILAVVWFVTRRAWLARGICLAAWVLLGAFYVQIRDLPRNHLGRKLVGLSNGPIGGTTTANPSPDTDAQTQDQISDLANGQAVMLTGHVLREGYWQDFYAGASRESIDLETDEIASMARSFPIRMGVRLTLQSKQGRNEVSGGEASATKSDGSSVANWAADSPPALTYGTRLRLRAKLHPPRNYRNPGAFDYEGYLRENGIAWLGSADAKGIELLPGFSGSRVERWRSRMRASIIEKIHQLWPDRQARLMDAMILGEESFLRNSTRVEYQRSGTYHVLVVSGMNLSILASAIFWALRQFRVDPAIAAIATVFVSFAYAFVVGVGPPVWRAALMLATYLGARLLYRERNMLNAIGAAALGVLVADPHALFGASFQLTFLAVFIIAGIGSPILERSVQPYKKGLRLLGVKSYDVHVSPSVAQFRLDLRLVASRLERFVGKRCGLILPSLLLRVALGIGELLFISALMQAGLALLMAYHFHRATTMGMPANLAVIPLTQVLMPSAAAALLLGYISPALAKPAVWASSMALEGIAGTVHWLGGTQLAGASVADLRVAMPTTAMVLASTAALAFAMFAVRRGMLATLGSLLSILSIFGVAVWIAFAPSHPRLHAGVMEMTAIDVGQGDSILLVTPEGRTLLVDAGGLPQWMHSDFDLGEQVVSSYLWNRGIDRLDVVAITHSHADHLGGMPAVIANFHPRDLWTSIDHPVRELAAIVAQAESAGIKVSVKKEGDQFDYGGAHFNMLAPGRDQVTGSMRPNDDCLVFTARFGGTTALLEGDAERPAERRIVEEHPEAMLLKVAHHGSASGTSSDLLATVHPLFALISVGLRNSYGHPRLEVLDRLQRAGVKTYRTDEQGAVSFLLDGRIVTPDVALLH